MSFPLVAVLTTAEIAAAIAFAWNVDRIERGVGRGVRAIQRIIFAKSYGPRKPHRERHERPGVSLPMTWLQVFVVVIAPAGVAAVAGIRHLYLRYRSRRR